MSCRSCMHVKYCLITCRDLQKAHGKLPACQYILVHSLNSEELSGRQVIPTVQSTFFAMACFCETIISFLYSLLLGTVFQLRFFRCNLSAGRETHNCSRQPSYELSCTYVHLPVMRTGMIQI